MHETHAYFLSLCTCIHGSAHASGDRNLNTLPALWKVDVITLSCGYIVSHSYLQKDQPHGQPVKLNYPSIESNAIQRWVFRLINNVNHYQSNYTIFRSEVHTSTHILWEQSIVWIWWDTHSVLMDTPELGDTQRASGSERQTEIGDDVSTNWLTQTTGEKYKVQLQYALFDTKFNIYVDH